jgi:hypothetical protein
MEKFYTGLLQSTRPHTSCRFAYDALNECGMEVVPILTAGNGHIPPRENKGLLNNSV